MPTCQNCGEHVTKRYVRVFAPPQTPSGQVRVCPQCEDKIRDSDGTIRDARSRRRVDQ